VEASRCAPDAQLPARLAPDAKLARADREERAVRAPDATHSGAHCRSA
jgi:hypothetical protein